MKALVDIDVMSFQVRAYEQERLEKFAEPIGMSGWRGNVQVQVSEKKLKEFYNSEEKNATNRKKKKHKV